MKKILGVIVFLFMLMFSFSMNSAEALNSVYEIEVAIQKLDKLSKDNFFSMINKSELIGVRYNTYNMQTMQYQTDVANIAGIFREKLNKIDIIQKSVDYSDTEKSMQLNNIYQEVTSLLNSVDTKTINYLNGLGFFMPSITYQRYYKNFTNYYNSLNVTGYQIQISR